MALCSKEKCELAEELGLHLEQRQQLPPLASRIYAILVLSSDEGFTFDELISITQASKSSVSTNVSLLVQLNFVEYYTKPGKRKRYFRGTGNYLLKVLQDYSQVIDKELSLVSKINQFNKNHNPKKFIRSQSTGTVFQNYLESQKSNLKATLIEMIAFQEEYKDH